jgi:septum formation protein
LASASPRRRELLATLGLYPLTLATDLDETPHPGEDPIAYTARLAREKSACGQERLAGEGAGQLAVLAADTTVVLDDGEPPILGKPEDDREARRFLERLSGRTHRVVTAFSVRQGAREQGYPVETRVTLRTLRPAEIDAYVASREWQGKAGGYAIQGRASLFVRSLEGSYSNVVGLPVCEVLEVLVALDVLPPDWLRAWSDVGS